MQDNTTQPKTEQQEPVASPIQESMQNPQPDPIFTPQPIPQTSQPNQESALVIPDQPTQNTQRQLWVKQSAQHFPRAQQEGPAQKKQRTEEKISQPTQVPRVDPNDTTRIQKG